MRMEWNAMKWMDQRTDFELIQFQSTRLESMTRLESTGLHLLFGVGLNQMILIRSLALKAVAVEVLS